MFDQDFLENMEDFVTLDELDEDEDEDESIGTDHPLALAHCGSANISLCFNLLTETLIQSQHV